MTTTDEIRRLAAADAATPPPPTPPFTAQRLEQLLGRRRRRDALLATGLLVASAALVAMLWPRPARADAEPRHDAAAIERQLQKFTAELASMREQLDATLSPLAAAQQELLHARSSERAAIAATAAADILATTDPEAAARQRARVLALWPDTAAAKQLAASPNGEPR